MNRTERTLTDQQRTAVATRDVSVVLSSGAGCGKTTVLTDRYLSHLERDRCAVSQLAAITFTDKAAREMRKRIREAIETRCQRSAEAEKKWWRDQLRDLETATISTIHSFCGELLRRFALAAGMDPGFEILEESIAPNLRDQVVRETLYDLLTADSPVASDLKLLVEWYGWPFASQTINTLVASFDAVAWHEFVTKSPNDIAAHWRTASRGVMAEQVAELRQAEPVVAMMQLLNNIERPNQKFADNVAIILDEWPKLNECSDPEVLKMLCSAAKVQHVVKSSSWDDPNIYVQVKAGFEFFRDCIKEQLQPLFENSDDLVPAAEFGQRFIRVASVCAEAYQAEKRRRGFIDFQDMLIQARDLLRDNKTVRHKCQGLYRFILVDELQDTDHVQMDLLELLCGKQKTKGKLFAVGDAKQSIYRFRGAEVEEFQRLRMSMPANGQQSLTVNFRSQPAILDFVNHLFEADIPDYEPLVPQIPQVTEGSCVEFLWTRAVPKNTPLQRQNEARQIAAAIRAMIDQGKQLIAQRDADGNWTTRAVQPKDIVLLFRAMTNVAIYETALRDAGLDYYLVGGRAFYAQQEIYDILNLLRVLENPHDLLSLAGVLRSPFGCVSDDGIYLLSQNRLGLWKALHDSACVAALPDEERRAAERMSRWLSSWRSVKDQLPIAALINRVLADSGYDAALRYESMAERKLANLWKLVDMARTFDAAGGFTLADFVDRLNSLVETPPIEEQAATQPEESNVIRLMSIHQAKGLEFPVVFVPDVNSEQRSSAIVGAQWDAELGCIPNPPSEEDPPPFSQWPSQLWCRREKSAERAEALRIFYVACTRAKDYLVLSGSWNGDWKPNNDPAELLKRRCDIEIPNW
jgi:ATP-dependent helicase/nuclease subunit A